MTSWDEVSKKTLEGAKQLAPWSSSLPWWVALIEGIVIGIVGLLIILDPTTANARVALVLAAALLISGFFQFLDLNRQRVPESVDGTMGARAGIAMFAGLTVILLSWFDLLTLRGGLVVLGLGSLVYGLLGFLIVFNTVGAQRRIALVESLFYVAVGALAFFGLFGGADEITTVVTILGWVALLGGIGLSVFAFLRRGHDDEIQAAINTVSETTANVTGTLTGKRDDAGQTAAQAASDAGSAASQVQDVVDDANRPAGN